VENTAQVEDQLVRQVQVVEAQEPFTLQHLMVEQTKVVAEVVVTQVELVVQALLF
jgi:hypothetical protein